MFLSLLALTFSPLQSPGDFQARQLVVDATGAYEVATPSSGGVSPFPGSASPLVTAPRWRVDDNGLSWIAEVIAVGDNGAGILAGKSLNNQSVTLYAGGDSTPLFDVANSSPMRPHLAYADRAPVAAAFVATDFGSGYVGEIQVWDTTSAGTPDWSYSYPPTGSSNLGGVLISDDGSIIFTWKSDPSTQTTLIRVFDRVGNLLANSSVSSAGKYNARQVRLSDDGTRAYLNISADALLYSTLTGTVLYTHNIGASFDSHALSGDGQRFAFGHFGYFEVWEEGTNGVWNLAVHHGFPGSTYVARLDLDQDGDRLAYLVQRYSPAYDHLDIGLFDVPGNSTVFQDSLDAPGTTTQLAASGVRIDDLGEVIAGCSWGDSLNATPEAFAYDATGIRTCELDTPGSVFGLDLGPDGDFLVAGCKSVHANTFGNGGSIFAADAADQSLHLAGVPRVGTSLQLQVADGWLHAGFAACSSLGNSPSSYGITQLDLTTREAVLGPYVIPPGGLDLAVSIPSAPFLIGMSMHVQGVVQNLAGAELSNKASLRLLP